MVFGLKRADLPEPPPDWGRAMGLAPDFTVKTLPTLAAVGAYCKANGVSANDAYRSSRFEACVIPEKREAVFAPDKAYGDPKKAAEVKAHEFFHTQGPVHVEGKGWFVWTSEGLTPVKSPADLTAGRLWAMQQAQSGVFARAAPPPAPAAGIFANLNRSGD